MIKFGMPEVLCLSATGLIISGNLVLGYTLLGLSIFWAFGRYSLEIQEKKEKRQEIQSILNEAGDFLGKAAKWVQSSSTSNDDKPRWN